MLAGFLLLLQDSPDFNREIRPILTENCVACHGPGKANTSGVRLDSREGALAALSPGKPDASELVRRIRSTDRDELMPPPKSGKKLDARQVDLLRRWVAQGAPWPQPWAFVAPARPALPAGDAPNPVDRFIRARLAREGLSPSPEAPRETLIRRVALDLTGVPPTLEEIDAFLADTGPDAYEKVVDRLVASPRYGERMALDWMDAARYADTHGLHVDSHREMWPWRDWVIGAFNRNLPYDRFTVEQLAGDLLPDATDEQRIATGFNRNHLISYQGSEIPEKLQVTYVTDRVNTTAAVWLGLTFACAQCHDHKFDPIPQADYYRLYAFFNTIAEKPRDGQKGNAAPLLQVSKDGQTTMVMEEMKDPRRETFLLVRGEYDKKGAKVTAETPGCLPPLPPDAPRNRLGLARWLVHPKHPLTARVAVNRLWQTVFGAGIVASSEDFGARGELPTHPDLLDWLAVEFAGERPSTSPGASWDVKAMLRLLVTSATYRQSARATPALLERDPQNRLLARGPRFRLPAELIRDSALAAAGLLKEKIGGPSVKPYQPAGVWEAVASQEDKKYTAQIYVQDHGDALYRRSLYTFWKRVAPPPALAALDAPSREACTVRRPVTNTPLQALVLMNDPTFVEAARALAERTLKASTDPAGRVAFAFRRATARRPDGAETEALLRLCRRELEAFRADPAAARRLLEVGESPRDASLDAAELAAWAVTASAILNLDEAITR